MQYYYKKKSYYAQTPLVQLLADRVTGAALQTVW